MSAPANEIRPHQLDLNDLKDLAYDLMGMSTAWRSAWNLSLEDEDPRVSKAPWIRVLKLEDHYTLNHHRKLSNF